MTDDKTMQKLADTVLYGDSGSKLNYAVIAPSESTENPHGDSGSKLNYAVIGPSESTENPPPYIEQHLVDGFERRLKERQFKRKGALVFCVACGAVNRTLRKWHNSYLCTDCFKIAQNVGDEKFIKALQGKEID